MSPRSFLLVPLSLAISALAGMACASRTSDAVGDSTLYNPGTGVTSDAGAISPPGQPDAATELTPATTLVGSPLCNATPSTCFPDHPTTSKACALAPDGGAYNANAGYDNAALSCRVVSEPGDSSTGSAEGQTPVCLPAGTAGDGSWCKSSGECLPAFDCVGAGTCQHYCCSGNIECVAAEFCDIQATVQASSVEVPVCMPIHPIGGCQLLGSTGCPPTETCSVVRDDGSTSCVAVGGAKAGQECDTDHCMAGLACLGATGQRVCYKLCHTAAATNQVEECSASQQCQGGLPLFPDPTIGICQ